VASHGGRHARPSFPWTSASRCDSASYCAGSPSAITARRARIAAVTCLGIFLVLPLCRGPYCSGCGAEREPLRADRSSCTCPTPTTADGRRRARDGRAEVVDHRRSWARRALRRPAARAPRRVPRPRHLGPSTSSVSAPARPARAPRALVGGDRGHLLRHGRGGDSDRGQGGFRREWRRRQRPWRARVSHVRGRVRIRCAGVPDVARSSRGSRCPSWLLSAHRGGPSVQRGWPLAHEPPGQSPATRRVVTDASAGRIT